MILINPCRARGVPREPRSQEGLLDERLAVRRGVIFVPWALLGPKKRFWIDLSTSSKIRIFWTLSKINKNGVAVRLVRILAALGAPKSKNIPQHGPKKRHLWTPKRSQCNMMSIFIETQIILWFPWYFALFDPQQSICSLFLCLKIYQKWSSTWSSLGNWQKGVLETSRGRKCPNGDVLGRFGAPSWNQEGPNIDPWSDQNRPRDSKKGGPPNEPRRLKTL